LAIKPGTQQNSDPGLNDEAVDPNEGFLNHGTGGTMDCEDMNDPDPGDR